MFYTSYFSKYSWEWLFKLREVSWGKAKAVPRSEQLQPCILLITLNSNFDYDFCGVKILNPLQTPNNAILRCLCSGSSAHPTSFEKLACFEKSLMEKVTQWACGHSLFIYCVQGTLFPPDNQNLWHKCVQNNIFFCTLQCQAKSCWCVCSSHQALDVCVESPKEQEGLNRGLYIPGTNI